MDNLFNRDTHQTAASARRVSERWLSEVRLFLMRPATILRSYERSDLRSDLLASLTVAVIMLPQAIAYALIAELPPQTGLYAAIVATIVGALWGSSRHLHTGPTNTTSLVVLAALLTLAEPGTSEYIAIAGLMAILVGIVRFLMGVARLGLLVNFVADSVIVGFTAGAGVLIGVNQVRHLLRLDIPSSASLYETVGNIASTISETHLPSMAIGMATVVVLYLLTRLRPAWPNALLIIITASAVVGGLGLDQSGVIVLGELPRGLPPLSIPSFDLETIRRMATGTLAVAIIGLIEATSISRAIAARSGQYLDSDQEFVGQGLANIVTGFFSGYPCSGSLTRTAINYESGSKTQISAVFSAIWVLLALLFFAPLAAFLPRTALAGIILVTAYRMINRSEMVRIWHTSIGDTLIMIVTLVATLLLPLEFAILAGVLVSFGRYIATTSTPSVVPVLPDDRFEHFAHQPDKAECPQLGVMTIEGSIYFGAAHHVEDAIRSHTSTFPEQMYLLLRMHRVNLMDISGIHMLETVVRLYRQKGGDLFITGVRGAVWEKMALSGFDKTLGHDHFLPQERAIGIIFYQFLNPARCIYQCPFRVWKECQSLPKSTRHIDIELLTDTVNGEVISLISPERAWEQVSRKGTGRPLLIDVREPEEFHRGHAPSAELLPLPDLIDSLSLLPADRPIYLICRSGRRSAQAALALTHYGYASVANVRGGMQAWVQAGLPTILD